MHEPRLTISSRRAGLVAGWSAAMLILVLLLPMQASAEVIRTQTTPSVNPTGRLFISPGRIEQDVQPGVRQTVQVTLINDSNGPFDVSLRATDLGQATDPRAVATQVEDGEFGAGDWLVPEVLDLRLDAFEQVVFDVVIDPPTTAPIGTNMAGLVVDSSVAGGEIGTADSESMFRVEGLIQIFLTVPGPVEHNLRIVDVDVRDAVILGGQRFAVWDVTFENLGTVNEHVTGAVAIRSIFGNDAHREQVDDLLVLRGAKRTTRIIWRDLPWVGVFTPEVRVRGDDARLVTATGERVIVMPWWLPVVIALTVIGPALWLWMRRRQEWLLYLEEEDLDEQADEDGAWS
jgi:hypothetical protein